MIGRAAGIGALAIASMLGGAQATQPLVAQQHQSQAQGGELKATREHRKSKEAINVNAYGGLDFNPFLFNDSGLSPKEYGLRFGTGKSSKNKSNRLRYSHNAKLKRRGK
jgi:hypothetical protein